MFCIICEGLSFVVMGYVCELYHAGVDEVCFVLKGMCCAESVCFVLKGMCCAESVCFVLKGMCGVERVCVMSHAI